MNQYDHRKIRSLENSTENSNKTNKSRSNNSNDNRKITNIKNMNLKRKKDTCYDQVKM